MSENAYGEEANDMGITDLFTWAKAKAFARREDPDTAKAAAARVGERATDLEEQVVAALKKWGPMTCREIADVTSLPRDTISPRIKPLRERGLVDYSYKDGAKLRRDRQYVWELC